MRHTAPDPLARLLRLRESCRSLEAEHAESVEEIERLSRPGLVGAGGGPWPRAAASARNLLHYLAIRREDLRDLHTPLAELGLSSLGRIEPHVLANLNAVIEALGRLRGERPAGASLTHVAGELGGSESWGEPITLSEAQALIEARTSALLGRGRGLGEEELSTGVRAGHETVPHARGVRIMVTLPSEAAEDASLVRSLLDAGMTCARINTAHDGPEAWERMSRNVRAESARRPGRDRPGGLGGECRVLMDLAGPKIRTGPMAAGPEVVRVKPIRDALGRVLVPASLTLRPLDLPAGAGPELPVEPGWLEGLRPGDAIEFFDTRGRRRVLYVQACGSPLNQGRVQVISDRTLYFGSYTRLRLLRAGGRRADAVGGRVPAVPQAITVRTGDRVLLSLTAEVGHAGATAESSSDAAGVVGTIACTLPEAFKGVKVGDPVWIDDGKIGATVETVAAGEVELRITQAAMGGGRIRADKGINLPETELDVRGLTADDMEVLPVAARHADMVGMSFVSDAAEVLDLRRRLDGLGGAHLGTVLKIETRRAFENLPSLLLAALQGPGAGVMIARGDLAVEVGYERLAEVQEEILWLCEAAHVPVIWATQVLETMAKTGRPSRAEVTDAAMGERADCVMLNKGPYIVEAVRFLDQLMRRMQEHQSKKRTILRSLRVARRFGRSDPEEP